MTEHKLAAFSAVASLVIGLSVALTDEANASVLINVEQVGTNVVATTSGTLNLSGATFVGPSVSAGAIFPATGVFGTLSSANNIYSGLAGPSTFGPGSLTLGTGTGDSFGFRRDLGTFGVPAGYISGTTIAATTTFTGQTIASLGATPGTYVFAIPNDTITLSIGGGSNVVPEPATWAMMLFGFAFVGGAMRSAKRKQKLTVTHA
jgi:hypothetical protein